MKEGKKNPWDQKAPGGMSVTMQRAKLASPE
jgi:hypothetical protein